MLVRELFEATVQSLRVMRQIINSNFSRRGLSITFPEHTATRSTVGERGAAVDDRRMLEAMMAILRAYDNKEPKLMAVFEVAINRVKKPVSVIFVYPYEDTALNMPCEIVPERRPRLVFTTVMVKRDFHPHSSHDIVIRLPPA